MFDAPSISAASSAEVVDLYVATPVTVEDLTRRELKRGKKAFVLNVGHKLQSLHKTRWLVASLESMNRCTRASNSVIFALMTTKTPIQGIQVVEMELKREQNREGKTGTDCSDDF